MCATMEKFRMRASGAEAIGPSLAWGMWGRPGPWRRGPSRPSCLNRSEMETKPMSLTAPIGILDEHPEWSSRLSAELESRRLPFERIDHSNHAFDPRDRIPEYSVIVNRTSPSSHTRGHRSVLFYAEALLAHYEAIGVPVINPVAAYRFEKSQALQLDLLERLGLRYPRAVVVNHPHQVAKVADRLRFPVVLKPNVGGSGAGIVRFDSRGELEAALPALPLGPDGVALLQEYLE